VASRVAVVAHAGKTMGGGLGELRDTLLTSGVTAPQWFEIAKGGQAPDCARKAIDEGTDLLFVWGGDGTVQRCIDVVAGTDTALAIVPAGTANLLARNLRIPQDIDEAVQIGLHGERQRLDTGTVNGEHFAVMAGAGLDALMIDEADAGLKDRFGRAAYLWTGGRNLDASPVRATVRVEGRPFFRGVITCILFGNLSDVGSGVELFDGSRADDGLLEFGVVSAKSRLQWVRTLGRVVLGRSENSPFVTTGRGTTVRVTFDRPTPYELDGGARKPTKKLKVKVRPASVEVCVPCPRRESDEAPGHG
jgi:diacylglycerol kinase family enzyme